MLTDGLSKDGVRREASLLKTRDVEVFAVGIGKAVRLSQLLQIATDRQHVSFVSFRALATLSSSMKAKICQRVGPTG